MIDIDRINAMIFMIEDLPDDPAKPEIVRSMKEALKTSVEINRMISDTDRDPVPREIVITAVAALLFARNDDGTDGAIMRSFNRAEQFVAEAERRYGSLIDG